MTDEERSTDLPTRPPDEGEEAELIERAMGGDVQAVARLYDEHQQAIFRYVWARIGDRPSAEDLAGETFLRMVTALPHYRRVGVPFRAWLFRIARNLVIDHYRKTGQRQAVGLEEGEPASDQTEEPGDGVDVKVALGRLKGAMERLEDSQREVIALRFLSGLSLQETAQMLRKSVASVKALQHRGLAGLRLFLEDQKEGRRSVP